MNGHDGIPVTWNTILDLIKGPLVNKKALAMRIYDNLKQESSLQQSGKYTRNYFNYHCTIRGTSNINYIISQYYMEHNRDELAILFQ